MVRRNKKRSPKKRAYRENTVGTGKSTPTEVIPDENGTTDNKNAPPRLANSTTHSASSENTSEDGGTIALPCVELPKRTEKETRAVEIATKDVASEKEIPTARRTNKQNSMAFFDAIDRSAQLVKSGRGTRLVGILEKVVSLAEDKDDGRTNATYEVLDLLLENLEDSNTAYVGYLLECLESAVLPKSLRKLYVEKDVVNVGYILLGNGSFGDVYMGHLDKPGASRVAVAIKEAKHERLNGMFVEEADVMARLDHENVLKILAVTRDEGVTKIVLEFMEEKDLFSAVISGNLYFGPADLLKAIHDVTCGMEYLEGKQFVHRDLKCQNVFVDIEKRCKIGDFGLCKYVGKSDGVYEDQEMRINGTHVAPETRNTNKFTSKSDVWAMGTLIWELYSVNRTWCESRDVFMVMITVEQMWKFYLRSGRLPQVDGCPVELHDYVSRDILKRDPMKRPNFENLRKKVENIMKKI